LRVERGDPSREQHVKDIPELQPCMEAPLLLLEEKMHRKQYQEETQKLFVLAPYLKDLHGLIYTMQQKHVDTAVMLLTFADWIGQSLNAAQENELWNSKFNHGLGQVLWSAFDGANTSSWSMLRRMYGIDLCKSFTLLSTSKQLTRVVNTHRKNTEQKIVEEKPTEVKDDKTENVVTAEEGSKSTVSTKVEDSKVESSTVDNDKETNLGVKEQNIGPPPVSPVVQREKSIIKSINVESPKPKTCEWKKHLDIKSGQYFYYHTPSGKSQWTQPSDFFEPVKKKGRSAPSLLSDMSPSPSATPKSHMRNISTDSQTRGGMKIG